VRGSADDSVRTGAPVFLVPSESLVMVLSRCCFCVPLRTGSLVIAISYLVINVCAILGWGIWSIVEAQSYLQRTVLYLFIGVLLGCGLSIAANSALIHAIRRNKRKYMLTWVIWYGIYNTLSTLAWLGMGIWFATMIGDRDGIGLALFIYDLVAGVVTLPVMWFWYACVLSYYVQLAPSDHYAMEPP